MSDDLPEEVESLRSLLSEELGVPEDSITETVERQVGLDISEIDAEDAEKAEEAWKEGDFETFGEVMLEYDVPEETVNRFLQMAEQAASPPEASGGSAGGGDLEKRVNQLEQEIANIPSQDEIADSVVHKLQGAMGGGGGGGAAPASTDGGQSQQNNLAPIISAIMQSQSGGGMGSMMEEAAMKSFTRKLTRPSLGEMMEMSMMKEMSEKMAPVFAEQMGDDWAEKWFSDPEREFVNGDSDDDE